MTSLLIPRFDIFYTSSFINTIYCQKGSRFLKIHIKDYLIIAPDERGLPHQESLQAECLCGGKVGRMGTES